MKDDKAYSVEKQGEPGWIDVIRMISEDHAAKGSSVENLEKLEKLSAEEVRDISKEDLAKKYFEGLSDEEIDSVFSALGK